jgi:glycosyltransferase involved in cell wall biosynthesis
VVRAMHGPASQSVLLLDISRLIWRARRKGPTGIDRVELAYAQHFIAVGGQRPALAVLHILGFVFAIGPTAARRFIQELSARWQGNAPATRWANLREVLAIYSGLFRELWAFGPWLRHKLRGYPGTPAFLVVSHHHLSRQRTIDRIRCTLGAKTVCFLHDLIPIDYPEYFKPGWEERYHRLASNVGQSFDAVIANSQETARSLKDCLKDVPDIAGTRLIRVAAPGARTFQPGRAVPVEGRRRPYFVVLGTIEPRKNHLLLLNLWTRLPAILAEPPRLLVIGHRGWENEQVVDMLERSRRLRGLVEEHNGLSDAQVGALVCGARALLLPSFAEGFGLPLAEALASGVPVICSDIPVFRELGREAPEYLDPLALQSWTDAIVEYSAPHSHRRAAQIGRLASWQAPSWTDHFVAVEELLRDLEPGLLPGRLTPATPAHRRRSALRYTKYRRRRSMNVS